MRAHIFLLFMIVFMISFCFLTSCQTTAQIQADLIKQNVQIANKNTKMCFRKVEINPAYQGIVKHQPLNLNVSPLPEQLADNSEPSDEDIKAIINLNKELEPCRTKNIEDLMNGVPGFIPTLARLYHAVDFVNVDLIQRKITWGEANKRRIVLMDEYREKAYAFFGQLSRELKALHEAELESRPAAWRILSQWSYHQKVLEENQPDMIHCIIVPDGSINLTDNCQ
jgi:hypothetical protein